MDKAAILELVDARADEYVELCSRMVQIPSENSPGDTTELALCLGPTDGRIWRSCVPSTETYQFS